MFLFLFAIAEVQLNNSLLCGEPAVVKRTRSLCVNDLAGMYWSFRQHPCKFLPSLQVTVSIKAWSSLYVHIARSGSVFNLSSVVKISYIWANLGGGAECTTEPKMHVSTSSRGRCIYSSPNERATLMGLHGNHKMWFCRNNRFE